MKLLDRGYIIVHVKQPFIDWANNQDEVFKIGDSPEPSIYLVEEGFFEDQPIIKANFKEIFENELEMVSDNTASYPEINEENFSNWFKCILGNSVIDLR